MSRQFIPILQSRIEQFLRRADRACDMPNMCERPYVERMEWLACHCANPAAVADPAEQELRFTILEQLHREYNVERTTFNAATASELVERMIARLPEASRLKVTDGRAGWFSGRSIGKAKIFVIEDDLMKAILESSLPTCEHAPMFPYPDVWVEPETRIENPLDTSEYINGMSMSFPTMLESVRTVAMQALETHRAQLPYQLAAGITSRDMALSQYHRVFSVKKTGGPTLDHWEYYSLHDCHGYDSDGVKNEQSSNVAGTRKPTVLTVRMLSYLVSSNVEYTLVKRADNDHKRKQQRHDQRPYYVTRVRKQYVHGIRDRTPSGYRVRRHDVIGHYFHRWYCKECQKAHAIRRFIADPPEHCVHCNAELCKHDAVVRVFWQMPHKRGADIAEQAARQVYKIEPPDMSANQDT